MYSTQLYLDYHIIELTRPTAPKSCTPNPNGNHNCSCTLYIYPIVGCQQLITPYVGGYPEPNITWLFNDTIAGSDNQNILTVKDNGSVSSYSACI